MFGTGVGEYFPLFLYLLSIAGCMASFIRPAIGVWILTLILPLQGGRMRLFDYPLGSHILQLLLLCVFIGVLLNFGSILPPKPMRKIIIALCAVTYISLWIGAALSPVVPFPFLTSLPNGDHTPFGYWFNFMNLPLLFVLVNSVVKDKRQMEFLLLAMMISFLWAMKNFYGNVGQRDITQYVESLRNSMGQDFGGSNGRAAFASQCTLFLIAFFGSIQSLRVRIIVVFLLAAGLYSVLFSYSRGAWLGFACGVLYLGITRMRWFFVAALLLIPFAGALLPPAVIQRASMTYQEGELDTSSGDRVEIWKHAMKTSLSDPLLGVGFDCYHLYRAQDDEELLDTHNMYVKAYVETGVVGLACLIGFFFSALRLGHRLARTATDPFYRALGAGFAAYMVSVIVVNIFGDRWTYIDLSSFTWILLALVIQATLWTQTPANAPAPAPAPQSEATVADRIRVRMRGIASGKFRGLRQRS
jgi:putative inorganic carbon (HCO3(-)) transporter